MMDLTTETIELLKTAIYSLAIVFTGMLLLNGVSQAVQKFFAEE
jgi:hypothetical protein